MWLNVVRRVSRPLNVRSFGSQFDVKINEENDNGISFKLTDEQREFQSLARKFAYVFIDGFRDRR